MRRRAEWTIRAAYARHSSATEGGPLRHRCWDERTRGSAERMTAVQAPVGAEVRDAPHFSGAFDLHANAACPPKATALHPTQTSGHDTARTTSPVRLSTPRLGMTLR